MSNIINNYYQSIKNIEFNQIPKISKPTMNVFEGCVKFDFKSKELLLQTRIKDLKEINDSLENDKKYNTLHKVLSVALLVTGIVLTTLATIFAFSLPVISIPGLGGILPTVYAALKHGFYITFTLVPSVAITGAGALYTFDSFKKIDWKEIEIKKIDAFNKEIEILKKIQEHFSLIRQKIEMELKHVDLIQSNSIDYSRIKQLRIALKELDKTKLFLDKYNL